MELIDLARSFDLGPHRDLLLERLRMFGEDTRAGEEGHAFECLCENLYEFDIRISQEYLERLGALGSALQVATSRYDFLRELTT